MNDKEYWKTHWTSGQKKPANTFAKRAYLEIKKKKLKTLLDVGCGDGRDSLYFANKGATVSALDFSKSGVGNLQTLNPSIKTYIADIREIKFPKESFDVIYAHLSLHYFSDKETTKVFENLYSILKKGGLVFIKCKSIDDVLYGKGKKISTDMYRKGHLRHFFSKEYMATKMKDFKILKLRKTSSTYHSYKSAFIEVIGTK